MGSVITVDHETKVTHVVLVWHSRLLLFLCKPSAGLVGAEIFQCENQEWTALGFHHLP